MADLDDFFAKKDKKKNKTKKVSEVKKQEKENNNEAVNVKEKDSAESQKQEEEEWKDFEEEKKDYTGLKLQQLSISQEDKNQTNTAGGDSDNEGQTDLENNSADNPWRKAQEQAASGQTKAKAPAPEPAPKATGVYVAPGQRNQAGAKKTKKGAPDLNSQEYFPSLGTEKAPEINKNKKDDFEEVKSGSGGKIKSDSNINLPISIGNRYTSLSNDAS